MTKRQNTGPIIPHGVSTLWDGLSGNDQDSLLAYVLTPITNHLLKSLTLLVYQYYECPYDNVKIRLRETNRKREVPLVNPGWVTNFQISDNGFVTNSHYTHPDCSGMPRMTLSMCEHKHPMDVELEWYKCLARYMNERYEVYVPPVCDMTKFIKIFSLHSKVYALFQDSLRVFDNEQLIRTIPLPLCFFCSRECGSLRFHDFVPFEGNLVIVFCCGSQFVVKHFTV